MTKRARFRQADIVRAIRGFQAAGKEVGSIILKPDGTIVIAAKGFEYQSEEDDGRTGTIFERPRNE